MVNVVYANDQNTLLHFARLTETCDRLPVATMITAVVTTVSNCTAECAGVLNLEAVEDIICHEHEQPAPDSVWLQWNETVTCPLSTFEDRLASVNDACNSGRNFADGGPKLCSLECGVELVPFYNDCRTTVDALFDAFDGVEDGTAAVFATAQGLCDRMDLANPVEELRSMIASGCEVDTHRIVAEGETKEAEAQGGVHGEGHFIAHKRSAPKHAFRRVGML
eukprot:SAG31_NODE_9834_length_1222_cov_0.941229_2_plen_222_part_00